jgi:FkbM family methyltransferase
MAIKFDDPPEFLNDRISGVKSSYYVPNYFNGTGICIDIGANVGAFPLVYGKLFNKIFCYEPAKYTYCECLKNLKDIKNIEIFNLAVTNHTDDLVKLKSHKYGNFSGNASIIEGNEWNNEKNYEFVKTISFADIIEQTKIKGNKNYVKIDTEGSEYEILMNTDLSMIDFLSVEIHIQLGKEKMDELMFYLLQFFIVIKSRGGNGFHYEITYKNKNLQ